MAVAGALRNVLAMAFAFMLISGGVAHAQSFSVSGYEQVTQQQGILSGASATVAAVCPAGKQVVGGGFDLGTSGTLEVSKSAPGGSGSLTDDRWLLTVRNAGQILTTATVVAECVTRTLPGYEIRTSTVSVGAGAAPTVLVLCSSTGGKVLSGGFELETASAFKLFRSLPTNASSFIDNGWSLFVQNTSTAARQATVYAICVAGTVSGYEQAIDQPTVAPGVTVNVAAACAVAGRRVTGGGFRVETPDDVKLFSTEPGNAQGVAIDNGWTNRVRNDGSVNRGVTVAAICVDGTGSTPPDTTITGGPSGPTNDTTPTFTFTVDADRLDVRVPRRHRRVRDLHARRSRPAALGRRRAHLRGPRDRRRGQRRRRRRPARTFTVDTTAPRHDDHRRPGRPDERHDADVHVHLDRGAARRSSAASTAAASRCTSPLTPATLADGRAHVRGARHRRRRQRRRDAGHARRSRSTPTAPDTTITGGPSGPTNDTTPTFTFTSTEARLDVRVPRRRRARSRPARSPLTTAALGRRRAHVRGPRDRRRRQHRRDARQPRTFTVDTDRARTRRSRAGRPARRTTRTPTFAFTSDEAGSTFECRVDAAAFATCTHAVHDRARSADGAHTFEVRAIDAAGNVDATPASRTFTVDTAAPGHDDHRRPDRPDERHARRRSRSRRRGRLDVRVPRRRRARSRPAPRRSRPRALADGAHTFEVRATDAAGNVDATPATPHLHGRHDRAARRRSPAARPARRTTPRRRSRSRPTRPARRSSAASTARAFAACTSPFTTGRARRRRAHLRGPRDRRGRQRRRDPGHAARSPSTRAAPDTTITGGPTGPTNDTTPTFTFPSTEAGSTFECRVDSAAFATCTSPFTTAALADGAHTFEVRATDAAGNVDATPATPHVHRRHDARPTTTITSGPTGPTNDTTPTFAFTSTEAGSTFECRVDAAAFAACTSPFTTAALGDGAAHVRGARDRRRRQRRRDAGDRGRSRSTRPRRTRRSTAARPGRRTTPRRRSRSPPTEAGSTFECRVDGGAFAACTLAVHDRDARPTAPHTFEVRAIDAAGNVDATPATRDVHRRHRRAPETTIAAGPTGPTNDTTPTFTFTADEAGATFECRVDGAAFAPAPRRSRPPALADGAHTFEVRATDAGGQHRRDARHRGRSPSTRPRPTRRSPPARRPDERHHADVHVHRRPRPARRSSAASTAAAFAPCTSPHTTARARPTAAHLRGPRDRRRRQHRRDARGARVHGRHRPRPTRRSTAGPTGPTNDTDADVRVHLDEAGATFECRVDTARLRACTSPLTTAALADGAHTFEVRATDAAGNTDADAREPRRSPSTRPRRTRRIDRRSRRTARRTTRRRRSRSPPDEPGATFECRVDGGAFAACTSPFTTATLAGGARTRSRSARPTPPATSTRPRRAGPSS